MNILPLFPEQTSSSLAESRPGVYRIVCAVNGRIYIGSSENVLKRLKVHLWALRNRRHPNRKLQNSWNRHGEASFSFSVVEYVDEERRLACEQRFIDTTNCLSPKKGFNVSPTATTTKGCRHSTKTLIALGEEWTITHPDGREENTRNLRIFCEQYGLDRGSMSSVSYGKCAQHKGGWKCRLASMSKEEWEALYETGRKRSRERNPNFAVGWIVTDPSGTTEVVKSLHAYCKARGLHSKHLSLVADIKIYYHKGYICRRGNMSQEEFDRLRTERRNRAQGRWAKIGKLAAKTYVVTWPNGHKEVVVGIVAFCKNHGILATCMIDVAKGKAKQHHGFKCRYATSEG